MNDIDPALVQDLEELLAKYDYKYIAILLPRASEFAEAYLAGKLEFRRRKE